MWIADGWNDYEVIDCSEGEKLERWGDYLLVRPDPQVIWNTPKTHRGWKKMNGHYHRSSKGGGEWEFFDLPEQEQPRVHKLLRTVYLVCGLLALLDAGANMLQNSMFTQQVLESGTQRRPHGVSRGERAVEGGEHAVVSVLVEQHP